MSRPNNWKLDQFLLNFGRTILNSNGFRPQSVTTLKILMITDQMMEDFGRTTDAHKVFDEMPQRKFLMPSRSSRASCVRAVAEPIWSVRVNDRETWFLPEQSWFLAEQTWFWPNKNRSDEFLIEFSGFWWIFDQNLLFLMNFLKNNDDPDELSEEQWWTWWTLGQKFKLLMNFSEEHLQILLNSDDNSLNLRLWYQL